MNQEVAQRLSEARERSLRLMRMDKQLDKIVKANRGDIDSSLDESSMVSTPSMISSVNNMQSQMMTPSNISTSRKDASKGDIGVHDVNSHQHQSNHGFRLGQLIRCHLWKCISE